LIHDRHLDTPPPNSALRWMRDKVAALLLNDWSYQPGFSQAGHLEIINLAGATPPTYGWTGSAACTPHRADHGTAAPMELLPVIERCAEWQACRVDPSSVEARRRMIRLVLAEYPTDRSA
jgi:hypothetical protein